MGGSETVFAVHLGVFASPDDRDRVMTRGAETVGALDGVTVRDVRHASAGQPAALDPDLPVGDLYAELPEQWREENPGQEPGPRETGEIRVVVTGSTADLEKAMDALTRAACPQEDHSGPCPIPWSAGFVRADDDASAAYLRARLP